MAAAKEIRKKIMSVKNTQKITKAMATVAASKMKRAQEQMRRARPYAEKILKVVNHLALSHSEYHHPFLMKRPIRNVGVLVVTSDRGLCGGLNISLLRRLLHQIKDWAELGIGVKIGMVGSKGDVFCRSFGIPVHAKIDNIGDTPQVTQLNGMVKMLLDDYEKGEIDAAYLFFNQYKTAMTQIPEQEQLLPIHATIEEKDLEYYWDYLYEPGPEILLNKIFTRYIESHVYRALVENIASEQASRMIAMNNASDNANKLIDRLQLMYNKARQASITQELTEIIGGANAV